MHFPLCIRYRLEVQLVWISDESYGMPFQDYHCSCHCPWETWRHLCIMVLIFYSNAPRTPLHIQIWLVNLFDYAKINGFAFCNFILGALNLTCVNWFFFRLPLYSEAKLAFIIYLWCPKTLVCWCRVLSYSEGRNNIFHWKKIIN